MRSPRAILLWAVLLVVAGGGSLSANSILQSSDPLGVSGEGEFGWAPSDFSGGLIFVGNGTNGVDSIRFEIFLTSVPGYFFPGSTISGSDQYGGVKINLNGVSLQNFYFSLGGSTSYVQFYNEQMMATEYVPLKAFIHITSFKYVAESPSYPLAWEGTFSVSPVAPIPEPATFGLVSLTLGLAYFGLRLKRLTRT